MSGAEFRSPAPHGASPDGPVGGAGGAFDFVGANFDWKGVALGAVRKYPIPCVTGAAAIGFWMGRYRGSAIVGGLAGLTANFVMRELSRIISGDGVA